MNWQKIDYNNEGRTVERLVFNWESCVIHGDCIVGEGGVIEIIEKLPQQEGEIFFYDVHFQNGKKLRVYNPNQVYYSEVQA